MTAFFPEIASLINPLTRGERFVGSSCIQSVKAFQSETRISGSSGGRLAGRFSWLRTTFSMRSARNRLARSSCANPRIGRGL